MGTYGDLLQRAVIGIIAMVRALGNSAGNALVGMTAHRRFLLFSDSAIVCPFVALLYGKNPHSFCRRRGIEHIFSLTFICEASIIDAENTSFFQASITKAENRF